MSIWVAMTAGSASISTSAVRAAAPAVWGRGRDLETAGKPLGQKAALQAVRSGRALPMEDIMLRAQLLTDGEIIDAQLVSLQDVLLYEIKALGKSGEVSELYFLAQTGEYLDLN